MKFDVRSFDIPVDKETYESWLKKRGETRVIHWDFMPPTGYLVSLDGRPVCAGFMIKCDNRTVINDGIAADPDAPREVRNAAVVKLREALAEEAQRVKARVIIAQTDEPKLVARLLEQGYFKIQENMTQLGRSVWQ